MMKKLIIITLILSVTILTNFRNGPTFRTGHGYTGAPGEEDGRVCQSCHPFGSFGLPVSDIVLEDILTGKTMQSYLPGRTYKVTVNVDAPLGFPSYGFQATVIDASGEDLGAWSGPLASNTQISQASVNLGDMERTYIEHTVRSRAAFSAHWTAPLCDLDTAYFYHIGNAVNGNNSTSGDNGGTGELTKIPPIIIDSLLLAQDSTLMGTYRAQEFIALNGIVGSGSNVYATSDFCIYVDESLVVSQTGVLTIDVDTCQ